MSGFGSRRPSLRGTRSGRLAVLTARAHDRTYGRGDAPLERSRSSLKDDLLEMTNAISGMSLAAALKAEGLRQDH